MSRESKGLYEYYANDFLDPITDVVEEVAGDAYRFLAVPLFASGGRGHQENINHNAQDTRRDVSRRSDARRRMIAALKAAPAG